MLASCLHDPLSRLRALPSAHAACSADAALLTVARDCSARLAQPSPPLLTADSPWLAGAGDAELFTSERISLLSLLARQPLALLPPPPDAAALAALFRFWPGTSFSLAEARLSLCVATQLCSLALDAG